MRQLLLEFAEELFRCGMHGDGRVGRHRFGREVAQVRVDAVQVVDVRRHGLEDARDHFVGLIRAGDEQELRGDGGTVFLLEGIGALGDGQGRGAEFLVQLFLINGMKTSGKKRDNLGSIGKSFRRGCNSIAESATKKEGNQPSFFVGG